VGADPTVDAHIHVWSADLKRYPLAPGFGPADLWRPSFTPEEYFGYAPAGVRINLVQMTWYGLDHSYITDLIAAAPDVFVGTGIVPAVSDVSLAPLDQTMQALAAKGVRAFRVRGAGAQPQWQRSERWLDQPGYQRMFACGADQNLALSFLTGPADLPEIGRMCARFPQTPVIIDHVGGIRLRQGKVDPHELAALCDLAQYPRVMVKLGPVHGLGDDTYPFYGARALLRPIVRAFGAQRCMWESDSGGPIWMGDPARDYAATVAVVADDEYYDETDKALILGGTAAGFFFSR
jgi:predicted TIM-barrel fold metal-dependent hydrolase